MTPILSYVLLGVIILAIWYIRRRKPSNLPPGPPGDPIIGHIRIMPTANQGDVFHDWAKIYGTSALRHMTVLTMICARGCHVFELSRETHGSFG